MLKEWAKPSFSLLTTMLTAPCDHRATAFDTCTPARTKPRPLSNSSNAGVVFSSIANSMNAVPSARERGGSAAPAITVRPVRSRSWSIR